MKKTKKLAALFLAVAMTASLAACSQGSTSSSAASSEASITSSSAGVSSTAASVQTITDGTLTMSTNAEFEPFEYKDNGNIVGIDVEIANKIAQKLGLKLKINDVNFDSLTVELQTNKCDFVAAGWSIKPDRQKNVDFSNVYYDASQAIIIPKSSSIKAPTDLNGKTVGVQQGTTGDTYCTNEDGKSEVKVGTVKRYNKAPDAILDLINGRIDAVVIDDFPATKYVGKNSDKIEKLNDALTNEQYAIGVKKGNTALLDVINGVLKDMESSGELDQIVEKYKQG
ncbi:transporter substrate-binding domain-containing protein [Caproiciproducens sp. NJN-50]|uniref:transporter substrate-binding domain-containing protein n=1 Tax=Acutalibacteraceae TaxID=3082771 RepID=UPI000FFE25AE|nr:MULTISPECIES: transporter substrate-binding domain-containing protein [Acutalibacteraceae]QAT49680.1 transporter substrate-binding domain-containing protein [Caproiciproducens sp. NJN-50]